MKNLRKTATDLKLIIQYNFFCVSYVVLCVQSEIITIWDRI